MSIRADNPRNVGFSKERARVEYAHHRLESLRGEGVADDAAWDQIQSELASKAALTSPQVALLQKICKANSITSVYGPQIRAGEALVQQGLAATVNDVLWQLVPTAKGLAIAKATGDYK